LPNAQWIRKYYGSKSVNLSNIMASYNYLTAQGGQVEEFYYTREEMERAKKHGVLADNLHTDLHEVIGHASGQLEPGVGTPKETLKNYASTLEEGRADLVALYFLLDEKLVEIGVMPSLEVGEAAYDDYISNGLMRQLKRLEEGENLDTKETIALCRCGGSANKPFCDGTHAKIGFSDAKLDGRVERNVNWQQPKLTSNVWKISKEGQPDSYLLGTIHMGRTNQTLSYDAVKLLQSTDQLTTEVDPLPKNWLLNRLTAYHRELGEP